MSAFAWRKVARRRIVLAEVLLISSVYKNDAETLELLAGDVMPAFAG
jgi:hypothetical protein